MNSELKNIKVIITDLDGTLLNPQHEISDYTKSVFKELHRQNYLIIVATGRHHRDAIAIMDPLEVPVYLVSSNGARIHSPQKDVLYAFDMESEVVKSALSVGVDPEISIVLFKENVWLANIISEKLKSYQADLEFLPQLVDYASLEDFSAIKIFFFHENHQKLVTLKDLIVKNGPKELHHAFSLPTCLEFMDKSIDKSLGIKKVLEREGFTLEESISFGDGFNDVQMLSATAKALIMGNAPDLLKETMSHLEVIKTNSEDGVAHYISTNILSQKGFGKGTLGFK